MKNEPTIPSSAKNVRFIHVGWQQRYICADGEVTNWSECYDDEAAIFSEHGSYEVRRIYAEIVCVYCDDTKLFEPDNNGPIRPCPLCCRTENLEPLGARK